MVKVIELTGTTSAGGAATLTGSNKVTGFIEKIEWDNVAADATADLTFTIEGITSQALLTITDQAQADAVWYPRHTGSKASDGSAFTNWATKFFLNQETVKLVIAQGGATKAVRAIVHISDGEQ